MSTGEFIHSISKRFRKAREDLGFSREKLSAALGVSADTIKNWENDSRRELPSAAALAMLQAAGADVHHILDLPAPVNGAEQDRADNELSPARKAAAQISTMDLTEEDATLVLALARRLCPKK